MTQKLVRDTDELKLRLTDTSDRIPQGIIDKATNQWQTRLHACVKAKGRKIEHLLWSSHTTGSFYSHFKHTKTGSFQSHSHNCEEDISAVTIIVVTIFIAIFQNYRIVFLSRYFLCVRNDIFARYLRYASTIEFTASLLKFQHASIMCREWLDACDCCPATVAEQHLRPWKTPQLPLK